METGFPVHQRFQDKEMKTQCTIKVAAINRKQTYRGTY